MISSRLGLAILLLSACKDDGTAPAGTDTEAGSDGGSSTGDPMGDSSTGPADPCGNGVMEGLEACDDGNEVNGDGCNRDCTVSETVEHTIVWDGGEGADCAEGVAVDSAGNIVAVGFVETGVTGIDIWMRKHDPELAETWLQLVDGPASGEDRARAVAIAPDDSIVVAGFVEGDGLDGRNIWVRKLDPAGETVWTHVVTGEFELGDDQAYGVTVLSDGSVVVVGEITVKTQDADGWISKLDADGNEQWVTTHDGGAEALDSVRGVAAGPGDEIFVTGWESAPDGGRRIWTARLGGDGSEVWSQTYSAGSSNGNVGHGVGVRSDLGAVATGSQREGTADTDAWIGSYTADGDDAWSAVFAGSSGGTDVGRGVGVGSDDTAAVVGAGLGFSGGGVIFVNKYDATGAEQWSKQIGGDTKSDAEGRAVAIDPTNDHLVVAGCQATAGDITSGDVMLAKITP